MVTTEQNDYLKKLKDKQHAPGVKMDYGKNRLGLVLVGFSNSLKAVGEIGTFGAKKYTEHGWRKVENAEERYTDAMFRHLFPDDEELYDEESGFLHAAHAAWNSLARLEFILKNKPLVNSHEN